MTKHRPATLANRVAFRQRTDPPGEYSDVYEAGTDVRIPLNWKVCVDSVTRECMRHRVEKLKTHVVVEVGGKYRLLEMGDLNCG